MFIPEVTGACYGDFGATRCELRRPPVSVTVCTDADSGEFTQNTTCTSQFVFTGKQCDGGTLFWGKNGPDEPFDPDNPDDPEHKPDDPTGDIEDPSVLPDDSTNTVTPPDVNDKPDVEDPDTDDSTDTAVLSAIKGLNADVNSGIHDLNIDVNESHAKINNAVIDLKASVVGKTRKPFKSSKSTTTRFTTTPKRSSNKRMVTSPPPSIRTPTQPSKDSKNLMLPLAT